MDAPAAPAFGSPIRCAWHDGRFGVGPCAGCQRGVCDVCATPVTAADGGAAVACPTCAPANGCPSSVPWEDPAQRGAGGFFRTFGWAWVNPDALFRCFPAAGVGRAVGFAYLAAIPGLAVELACVGVQSVLTNALLRLTALGGGTVGGTSLANDPSLPPAIRPLAEWFDRVGPTLDRVIPLAWPVGWFLLLPLGLLLLTLLYHVPAVLLGSRAGFGTTFRMLCYTRALSPLYASCGPIHLIWHAVVMFTGLRRMHGLSGFRALLVALAPVLIGITCFCGGGILLVIATMGLVAAGG